MWKQEQDEWSTSITSYAFAGYLPMTQAQSQQYGSSHRLSIAGRDSQSIKESLRNLDRSKTEGEQDHVGICLKICNKSIQSRAMHHNSRHTLKANTGWVNGLRPKIATLQRAIAVNNWKNGNRRPWDHLRACLTWISHLPQHLPRNKKHSEWMGGIHTSVGRVF